MVVPQFFILQSRQKQPRPNDSNPFVKEFLELIKQVIDDTPRPYEFGYEFGDGQGMNQHRRESSDGAGKVKGSYSYTDPFGVYRNVEYQADADGYRAVIKSNEPGLSNQNAATQLS
ncbi:cuticle protein 16.8 [Trichonephila inaurata madagascariensis]|uniref:Cuticle protein 16.8 n=1 Tax=Trichonephila inaurata madagascariensis TaxID=2747483 RepID=A0A8X6YGG9_9ARAC|nr:cuticle protein 16.8 [Trichonephila inaurata madagascariensis]